MLTLVFLRIRNRYMLRGLIRKKILKNCWDNRKNVSMSWKLNLCICVWGERKKNSFSFEIRVIIFTAYKKCSNFKKDFKSPELLTKTSFFLYFRDRPKIGEGNKGDVESICARVTSMHQNTWRKLRLIWIDYEQLIMDCFRCIFESTDHLAHLIPVF